MEDNKTMLDKTEEKVEILADKAYEGANKLEGKVLEVGHKMVKGTENLVDSTLKGLHAIEDQLKHKK